MFWFTLITNRDPFFPIRSARRYFFALFFTSPRPTPPPPLLSERLEHATSFPINWPSLVSTARSPIILWRLWSHKPSHKHNSNKYQSKAFVICDHKSDETRSMTHINKAYLVWLIIRVLSDQHYQHRTNQKLRSWRTQFFEIVGFAGKRFFLSPLACSSFWLVRCW